VVTISRYIWSARRCRTPDHRLGPSGDAHLANVGHFLATLHVKDWGERRDNWRCRVCVPTRQDKMNPRAPSRVARSGGSDGDRAARRWARPGAYVRAVDRREEVSFMDDKDCNLRAEFDLFKAADYKGLLKAALANAESCHVTEMRRSPRCGTTSASRIWWCRITIMRWSVRSKPASSATAGCHRRGGAVPDEQVAGAGAGPARGGLGEADAKGHAAGQAGADGNHIHQRSGDPAVQGNVATRTSSN